MNTPSTLLRRYQLEPPGDSIIIETGQEYQHIVESMAMSGMLTDFLALHVTREWGDSVLDLTPIPGYRFSRPTNATGQESTRKRTFKSLLNQNRIDTQNNKPFMQSRQLFAPSQSTENAHRKNEPTSQDSPLKMPQQIHATPDTQTRLQTPARHPTPKSS